MPILIGTEQDDDVVQRSYYLQQLDRKLKKRAPISPTPPLSPGGYIIKESSEHTTTRQQHRLHILSARPYQNPQTKQHQASLHLRNFGPTAHISEFVDTIFQPYAVDLSQTQTLVCAFVIHQSSAE